MTFFRDLVFSRFLCREWPPRKQKHVSIWLSRDRRKERKIGSEISPKLLSIILIYPRDNSREKDQYWDMLSSRARLWPHPPSSWGILIHVWLVFARMEDFLFLPKSRSPAHTHTHTHTGQRTWIAIFSNIHNCQIVLYHMTAELRRRNVL